ncbi:hypothetical protein ACFVWY_21810 [Streptomyces sp. NPDC058195]|uniref:hypothetical protein n=1 Tax=Streptomyces sp. NPDC058195 TaxID=3346375 RepID=UPI0036EDE7F5
MAPGTDIDGMGRPENGHGIRLGPVRVPGLEAVPAADAAVRRATPRTPWTRCWTWTAG